MRAMGTSRSAVGASRTAPCSRRSVSNTRSTHAGARSKNKRCSAAGAERSQAGANSGQQAQAAHDVDQPIEREVCLQRLRHRERRRRADRPHQPDARHAHQHRRPDRPPRDRDGEASLLAPHGGECDQRNQGAGLTVQHRQNDQPEHDHVLAPPTRQRRAEEQRWLEQLVELPASNEQRKGGARRQQHEAQ